MMQRYFFLLLLGLSFPQMLWAQVKQVYIQSIDIQGLKITKRSLVENELSLHVGDSLPLEELQPALEANRRFLINTFLFTDVKVNIGTWEGDQVQIKIKVQEAWYVFPLPQFELADRNFNIWWTRHQRDFRRANLGLWLIWRNLSGYNDLLKTIVQFGYTRKFELEYTLPPMARARKFGFQINALYSDNREVAFNTVNNQLAFYNDFESPSWQYQRIRGRLESFYRGSFFETHRLALTFLQLSISDTIQRLNPRYFPNGQRRQRSFNLRYNYTLDRRDIQVYPLNGYYIQASAYKEGLGIFQDVNLFSIQANLTYYTQIVDWLSIGSSLQGRYHFIKDQRAYVPSKALGYYETFVRGYEYYVIDGMDYLLWKTDINFRLLQWNIPLFKKIEMSYLHSLPIRIHFRLHLDFGYVWNQLPQIGNRFSNTDLWGTGIGLDFVFYAYNIIVQLEYTFNKTGEKGLYLRYKFNF